MKMEIDCIKNHYNNLQIENNSKVFFNLNYSRELKQKTELLKDFKRILISQLRPLSRNWNLTSANISKTGNHKAKSKDMCNKSTETFKVFYNIFKIFGIYYK